MCCALYFLIKLRLGKCSKAEKMHPGELVMAIGIGGRWWLLVPFRARRPSLMAVCPSALSGIKIKTTIPQLP